eukprot:CAMPEP_0202094846 /NCGR_PEP_ID=MMETSP0964-20121228/49247_1 /ASSEMBLY_ACC=CAM_ASM_000500 /TAXON_ID=4773 /ORGANISM="Schizochytrium aggregatum, Strain ATCC28209" /LENGTH=571 /DNA_ID=CAMNT_0048663101 /DNA_START=68 /DNA_END=1780 /DNA_ORIENTATION=-
MASALAAAVRLARRQAMPGAKRGIHSASNLRQSLAPVSAAAPDTNALLARMNEDLQPIEHDPLAVLRWTMEEFDGRMAMSTSFGIQSAVLLHLATQIKPDIPVVWVDTGYLPAETYRYAQELTDTLGLNLHVASNERWTPARMEAIYGKLWEKDDAESHGLYGRMRKVEPMHNALAALEPNPLVLLSGLRASQTKARANMPPIGFQQGRFKVLPLLRMTDDAVADYMDRNDLPFHPLQSKGYVTVGDWHSSRPVEEGEDPRNTRFGGKFQECGLHVEAHDPVEAPQAAAGATSIVVESKAQDGPELPLKPESLQKTGVKALGLTRANKETGVAVIMVKKLTEDGSYCRKCNDVAEKIVTDGLSDWIGETCVADVLDSTSEGAILAKHFGVATAPFFLVRDRETEDEEGEWQVVRSYLQLRKKLEKAAEEQLAVAEHPEDPLAFDSVYQDTLKNSEQLKMQVAQLQIDLRDKSRHLQDLEANLKARAHDLGVTPHHNHPTFLGPPDLSTSSGRLAPPAGPLYSSSRSLQFPTTASIRGLARFFVSATSEPHFRSSARSTLAAIRERFLPQPS